MFNFLLELEERVEECLTSASFDTGEQTESSEERIAEFLRFVRQFHQWSIEPKASHGLVPRQQVRHDSKYRGRTDPITGLRSSPPSLINLL
jgi:hypothetical protein